MKDFRYPEEVKIDGINRVANLGCKCTSPKTKTAEPCRRSDLFKVFCYRCGLLAFRVNRVNAETMGLQIIESR